MYRIRNLTLISAVFFLFSCAPVSGGIPATSVVIYMTPNEMPASLTHTLSPSMTPYSSTETTVPTEAFVPTLTLTAFSALDTATPKPALQLCSPLEEQSIQEILDIVSGPYNPPRPGKDDRHHGTDFAYYRRKDRTTIEGERVQALLAGRVAAVIQDRPPYGNMVIIETPDSALPPGIIRQLEMVEGESLYTLYAHLKAAPLVTLGDRISCGQTLGKVGATGYNIVQPHLHLETRIGPADGMFLDGMAYYDTGTTEAERTNYELWRTSGVFRHFDPMSLINAYLLK